MEPTAGSPRFSPILTSGNERSLSVNCCPPPVCVGGLLPTVFVNGGPHAFIVKTNNNQSQGAGGDTFKVPTFLPHV